MFSSFTRGKVVGRIPANKPAMYAGAVCDGNKKQAHISLTRAVDSHAPKKLILVAHFALRASVEHYIQRLEFLLDGSHSDFEVFPRTVLPPLKQNKKLV